MVPPDEKFYSRSDLALFDLLEQPIYVFDIKNKKMWYANKAAVAMWNAPSLEALVARDFASDMSEASECRMQDYLRRFSKGERVREQWTMYPNGKKVTVNASCSGIYIGPGHVAILSECELSSLREVVDHAALRGVEMLRHLPVAVSQFDIDGNLMEQNPEALGLFGGLQEDCFVHRFVDPELGTRVLQQVQNGNDYCVEAQQRTTRGPCWSAIKVRRSIDPVTETPIILYSARDISDVIKAKNEADQANMEKSEMLAVLSHEIRTPLHQVIGFIELLEQTNLSPEQRDYLNSLQISTTSLMTIINDILDYTKLEAGKMEIEAIPFDPKGVCKGCTEVVRPVAEKKRIAVTNRCECITSLPPGRVLVGDPNRIRQVLLNLLSNAVKFTCEGEITLSMHLHVKDQNSGLLKFIVADTGIGISPEHCSIIFNKYCQTDASVARQYGGTGLGLAICKVLAETMGGSLTVKSEVNKGSEFVFEIPVAFCCAQDSPVANDEELGKLLPSAKGLRILVAEDNKMNQKLVAAMLKRGGHSATIVDNGKLAVEEVEARKCEYDLLLTDICMPVMDGIEATKLIRSKGWSKAMLPVIGLTASYQTADVNFYLKIGMNACIGKPVRMKMLQEVITRIQEETRGGKMRDDDASNPSKD